MLPHSPSFPTLWLGSFQLLHSRFPPYLPLLSGGAKAAIPVNQLHFLWFVLRQNQSKPKQNWGIPLTEN